MTTNETGVTVWFPVTGLSVHLSRVDGQVMRAGQALLVTPAIRELNTGRDGSCVFDLSPDQQRLRFNGRVMFEIGEPPPGFRVLEGFALDDARAAALREAAALPDPEQQRIAAAKVRERFGSSSEASSKTLAHYK